MSLAQTPQQCYNAPLAHREYCRATSNRPCPSWPPTSTTVFPSSPLSQPQAVVTHWLLPQPVDRCSMPQRWRSWTRMESPKIRPQVVLSLPPPPVWEFQANLIWLSGGVQLLFVTPTAEYSFSLQLESGVHVFFITSFPCRMRYLGWFTVYMLMVFSVALPVSMLLPWISRLTI